MNLHYACFDKKQFLKELTNFSYSFAKYFNNVEIINKLEKSVDNLQQVNLKFQNWKLLDDIFNNFWELKTNNKWYILLLNNYVSNNWSIIGGDSAKWIKKMLKF